MVRPELDLAGLRQIALPEVGATTLVAPYGSRRGRLDEQWNVVVNATVDQTTFDEEIRQRGVLSGFSSPGTGSVRCPVAG